MMRFSPVSAKLTALAAAITVVALAAIGCGSMPTSPVAVPSGSSMSANAGTEGASALTIPVEEPSGNGTTGDQPVNLPTDASDILTAFGQGGTLSARGADLPGNTDAMVQNGRWRVEVPAGAIDGPARITITIPGAKGTACDLSIAPAEKNHFAVPVRLVADCHGVPPHKLMGYAIYWYNPDTQGWVKVPGSQVDLKKKTVSAPLEHFSIYAVGPAPGKPGW
jgi:hypothetical protein